MAEIEQLHASTDYTRAQAAVAQATIPKLQQDVMHSLSGEYLNKAQESYYRALWRQANSMVDNLESRTDLTREEIRKVREEVLNVIESRGLIRAETASTQARAILQQLDIPRSQNIANVQPSWWMRNVSPFLEDWSRLSSGARAAQGYSFYAGRR